MKTKKQIFDKLHALTPILHEAQDKMDGARTWAEILRLTATVNYIKGKIDAYGEMLEWGK